MDKKHEPNVNLSSDEILIKMLCLRSKAIIDRFFVANGIKAQCYTIDADDVDLPQPTVVRIRSVSIRPGITPFDSGVKKSDRHQ